MPARKSPRSPTSSRAAASVRSASRPASVMGSGALAGFALWRDAMAWQRGVDRALRRLGLTHTQTLVLSALDSAFKRAGAVTQNEIATEAGLDKVTVSGVLKTLDSRGLVNRGVGLDRRVWRVILTSKGERTLAAAAPLVEEVSVALPGGRR